MTTTQNTSTNQQIIDTNRISIERQLQDIESTIEYIRRSFDHHSHDWISDPELHMSHQANNMMVKVMELCALIATNKAIIQTSI